MTNITYEHREDFAAIRNPDYNNFALFSCFVNGEPASAIVALVENPETGDTKITPLFVSITPSMVLTDHDGTSPTN